MQYRGNNHNDSVAIIAVYIVFQYHPTLVKYYLCMFIAVYIDVC